MFIEVGENKKIKFIKYFNKLFYDLVNNRDIEFIKIWNNLDNNGDIF